MSTMVFVSTTGLGIQALEFARKRGHDTTLLWSPRYDYYIPSPEMREEARAAASRAVMVEDLHDPAAVLAAVRGAGLAAGEVDAVLTTMHPCVVPAALLADALGARGTSLAAIQTARDKGVCREVLNAHGIPNLGFGVVTDVDAALATAASLGYPVVVKPVTGFAKTVTAMARTPEEVVEFFQSLEVRRADLGANMSAELDERFIVEEVAVGPLFSVEVATDGRSFTALAAVRRKTGRDNPVLELGSTVPTGLSDDDESRLGDYAIQVCRALGLNVGIFHVEVILTRQGFRLVEVNPRIAGGTVPEVIRAATEHNLFEALVELFEGGPVPPRPFPLREAASHSFLAVDEDCTVRDTLPPSWFDAYRPRLHSGDSSIAPGSRLQRMGGNFSTHGVVRVVAEDFAAAEGDCAQIRSEIEDLLGITFTRVAPTEIP